MSTSSGVVVVRRGEEARLDLDPSRVDHVRRQRFAPRQQLLTQRRLRLSPNPTLRLRYLTHSRPTPPEKRPPPVAVCAASIEPSGFRWGPMSNRRRLPSSLAGKACTWRPKQPPVWTYRFEFLLPITRPAGDS